MSQLILEQSVSMIPFGRLSAKVDTENEVDMEVRVTEVSTQGFIFRTACRITQINRIILKFLDEKRNQYHKVELRNPQIFACEEKCYYTNYLIYVNQNDYTKEAERLIANYYQYIMQKLEGDDAILSQKYVNYPAKLDEEYVDDFSLQKKRWYEKCLEQCIEQYDVEHNVENDLCNLNIEVAVELDQMELYQSYLEQTADVFWQNYGTKNHFNQHPIIRKNLNRIYIGNQFCHNLFLEEELLFSLMEKAKKEKLAITIVTTYLREEYRLEWEMRIQRILKWCRNNATQIEIVINDWGMLDLLEGCFEYMTPILGILLNKRRKDPRLKYKKEYGGQIKSCYEYEIGNSQISKNSLNSTFYQEYLENKFQIKRYEFESCGYFIQIPKGRHSLHIPFYQTNTSQYCPLYARCKNGDRGMQSLVINCPKYCKDYVFSYPDHLHMVGRYNSIFGFDQEILSNLSIIERYAQGGIDRLVINLM